MTLKLWRLDGAGTWEGDKSVLDLKIGRKLVSVSCDNPGTIGKVLVGKESLRRLVAEDESDCDGEIAVHGMGPWSVSIAGSARMCLALLPSCTRIGGRQRRNQLRQLSGISVA